MTTMVAVRPLTAGDHAAWLPLWQGYQRFYRVTIADDVTRLTWGRLNDPAEPMFGALALGTDGTPAGLVHWLHHRSTWSAGDECYLQDLYVTEAARGQGAGRALIEYVTDAARQAGCAGLYWLTHETNATARQLYDRVARNDGFVQYVKGLGES